NVIQVSCLPSRFLDAVASEGIEPPFPECHSGVVSVGPQGQRKGQELNLQGVAARPLSKRLPSPIGLPLRVFLREWRKEIHCIHDVDGETPSEVRGAEEVAGDLPILPNRNTLAIVHFAQGRFFRASLLAGFAPAYKK